jgi:hypothetical protein
MDCRTSVSINQHARCEQCDSDAVDTMERLAGQSTASSIEPLVGAAVVIEVPAHFGTPYKPWYRGVDQILVHAAQTLNELTERSRLN